MTFCTDTDLLHWEPDLLDDAAFVSQFLTTGTGALADNLFTSTSGAGFDSAAIEPGLVLILSGALAATLPIVGVESADELRVSVLYNDILGQSGDAASPFNTLAGAGLTYIIRTFWAQRQIVSDFIRQAAGLNRVAPEGQSAPTILNPADLRRVCALGTLQMIYSALAAAATEPARLNARADLYERLYRRALRQTRIDIDTDGDGRANTRKSLGIISFSRE